MISVPFALSSKPRILSPWRIRNDRVNIVLYRCLPGDITYKVLSPYEASILPFFDGNNTMKEIYSSWIEIHRVEEEQKTGCINLLNNIISTLLKDKGIIGEEGERSPSFDRSASFVPDFGNYIYPAIRLQRPISVNLAITNRCRTNCRYCYAERRICPEMNPEKIKNLLDELCRNEIFIVDILGGDIFAREDALQILEEMVKRDFVFFLSTKCHISEDMAGCLYNLGIGRADFLPHLNRPLQISVDSTIPETAAFLVQCPDYLDRAVSSVRNAVKAGLSPRIKSVLTAYNADAPTGIVDLFYPLGITEFQFVQYGRSHYRHDESLFLSLEQKLKLRDMAVLFRNKYPGISLTIQEDVTVGEPLKKEPERWNTRAVCSGGRVNMIVQPNGDVTLCDQIPHTVDYTVGNLLDQGLQSVWNSSKLLNFLNAPRKLFKGSACYDCTDFETCHYEKGYCYRESLFHYGTVYEAPPDCPYQSRATIRQI